MVFFILLLSVCGMLSLSAGATHKTQEEFKLQNEQLFLDVRLIQALEKNSVKDAEYALEKGANPDSVTLTPLHVAVKRRNINLIKLLLDCKADINIKDSMNENDSVLHTAIHWSAPEEIFDFLVKKNASLDIQNNNGNTPLHCAVSAQNVSLVKKLLEYKAPIFVQNKKERTPLDAARAKEVYLIKNNCSSLNAGAIVKLLQDAEIEVKMKNMAINGSQNTI